MLAVTISTVLWLSSGANLPANKPINAQDHATQAGAIAKTSSNRHVPSHVPRDTQSAKKPHVMMILLDDFGWSEVSWHRNYTIGGLYVPPSDEVSALTRNAALFFHHSDTYPSYFAREPAVTDHSRLAPTALEAGGHPAHSPSTAMECNA